MSSLVLTSIDPNTHPLWDPRLPAEAVNYDFYLDLSSSSSYPEDDQYILERIQDGSLKVLAYNCLAVPLRETLVTFATRRIGRYLRRNRFNIGVLDKNSTHRNAKISADYTWAHYNEFVPACILPKGERFKAALCFRSDRWLTELSCANQQNCHPKSMLDTVLELLKTPGYFGSRLKVINIQTVRSIAASELASQHALVLPAGFPEEVRLSCVLFEMEASN